MKLSEVKVGDLISTEWGLARVMEILAPAFCSCIIVSSTGRDKTSQGDWIYLRGLALERAKTIF